MVAIGRLNRLISIEASTPATDSSGFDSGSWSEAFSAWAKIEPTSGREYRGGEKIESETTHNFTIRFQAGITPAHRIVYSGRVFDIESVINPNEKNQYLILSAIERD
jgi:SPP1 family predicted phage head-tail adaptor